ncbi:MAG: hypothetical protein ACREDP_19445 [Bradyrhizobium sp.]
MLLYVGKSAGPLGGAVGSSTDQEASSNASTDWMMARANETAFWQFINPIAPTRRTLAWSNVCKMDQLGGRRPPTLGMWRSVAEVSVAALRDELTALSPHVALFVTSAFGKAEMDAMLSELGYCPQSTPIDHLARVSKTSAGRYAVQTRHPQGWQRAPRDEVRAYVARLLLAV